MAQESKGTVTFIFGIIILLISLTPLTSMSAQEKGLPTARKVSAAEAQRFAGMWEYEDHGSTFYVRISQLRGNTFMFKQAGGIFEGKLYFNESTIRTGKRTYVKAYPGLKMSNGKLTASFISVNFTPTHGAPTLYKMTLTPLPDGTLRYALSAKVLEGENRNMVYPFLATAKRSSKTE